MLFNLRDLESWVQICSRIKWSHKKKIHPAEARKVCSKLLYKILQLKQEDSWRITNSCTWPAAYILIDAVEETLQEIFHYSIYIIYIGILTSRRVNTFCLLTICVSDIYKSDRIYTCEAFWYTYSFSQVREADRMNLKIIRPYCRMFVTVWGNSTFALSRSSVSRRTWI